MDFEGSVINVNVCYAWNAPGRLYISSVGPDREPHQAFVHTELLHNSTLHLSRP